MKLVSHQEISVFPAVCTRYHDQEAFPATSPYLGHFINHLAKLTIHHNASIPPFVINFRCSYLSNKDGTIPDKLDLIGTACAPVQVLPTRSTS